MQPTLTACGIALDSAPDAFGEIRASTDIADDPDALRQRLADDGYLFVPGYLDRGEVLAARTDLLDRLGRLGIGSTRRANPGELATIAKDSTPLMRALYGETMIGWYERLFGEPVRHFDYTWLRAIAPGPATRPHMDSVFMNRGSHRLLTSWTPLGDVDLKLGGLAILEGSHQRRDVTDDYGQRDVDTYCSNEDGAEENATKETLVWNGALSDDPARLRAELGLRWLTTEYRAGDLLTFTIFTAHMGLDNRSDQLRLSADSRYQPASEPADPRWIGANPSAHGSRSKQGVIC